MIYPLHICVTPLRGWGWTCWLLLYSPDIYLWFCFRERSGLHCWRRRVEVASAPNFACGVGPLLDASASALLWARAGPRLGRSLVYHRSRFTGYHRLYRVSASTEVVRWLNYLLNKCVISLLGLIFVSHLVSTFVGTPQVALSLCYPLWAHFVVSYKSLQLVLNPLVNRD